MGSINIKFPIEDDVANNRLFKMNTDIGAAVRSDLLLLLLTEKGTRIFNRRYGTNIKQYLFEPNDEITDRDIIEEIKANTLEFMPKLVIENIVIKDKSETRAVIDIKYQYSDGYFSVSDTLNVSFSV
jgi:phage baseplate assembly protein W